MVIAMEGGEITKKHAKFHKLDAEGIGHNIADVTRPKPCLNVILGTCV